jgi:hypothetical protein
MVLCREVRESETAVCCALTLAGKLNRSSIRIEKNQYFVIGVYSHGQRIIKIKIRLRLNYLK